MKVFYEYMAHDSQDNWLIYKDEKLSSTPEEAVSPKTGNAAVTCQRQYISDYCFISFIPAARGEKKEEMYHHGKNRFFIYLYGRDETESYLSKNDYEWDKACELAKIFSGVPFSSGKRIWKAKKI